MIGVQGEGDLQKQFDARTSPGFEFVGIGCGQGGGSEDRRANDDFLYFARIKFRQRSAFDLHGTL